MNHGKSLFLASHCFAKRVQRIFNRNKIQGTILTPDNLLNISIYRSHFCVIIIIHELQTRQNGPVIFLAHSVYTAHDNNVRTAPTYSDISTAQLIPAFT